MAPMTTPCRPRSRRNPTAWRRCARWLLAAPLLACSDRDPAALDPDPDPDPAFQIVVDGRLERGLLVPLALLREGSPVPAGAVAWTAEPSDRVAFEEDGLRLLEHGDVTLTAHATVEDTVLNLSVSIARPPLIVFEALRDGRYDIFRMELDGRNLVNLTDHPAADRNPTVAADAVVFTSFRDGNAELYRIPLQGGEAVRLTTNAWADSDPALSRDGERLAYISRQTGQPRVWIAAADATGASHATNGLGFAGSLEASPDWSPDSDEVVFVSTHLGSADLFVLDRVAGEVRPLVVSSHPNVQPAWSPDGSRIAFASERGEGTDLYLADAATGAVTRLTNRAETDAQPAWIGSDRLVFMARVDGQPTLRWLELELPIRVFDIPMDGGAPEHPAVASDSGAP